MVAGKAVWSLVNKWAL